MMLCTIALTSHTLFISHTITIIIITTTTTTTIRQTKIQQHTILPSIHCTLLKLLLSIIFLNISL
jgi:hypothetical protein